MVDGLIVPKLSHDELLKLATGKPIALGEVAPPPTPEILAAQPNWVWFMPWGNLVFWGNGPEIMKEIMHHDRILTREDIVVDKNGYYHINRSEHNQND